MVFPKKDGALLPPEKKIAFLLLPKMKVPILLLPKMKTNGLSTIRVLSAFIFYKHSIS